MDNGGIYKTVRQYSREPIPADGMRKLTDIAEDYRKVKNEVYDRYGGIGGLSKLYPGYTVQNEMTESGLRQRLGMPSVYFYLAIFDALGDIKARWSGTRSKVLKLVAENERFTEAEKHYLRFLLKVPPALAGALCQTAVVLSGEIEKQYASLAAGMDTEKLHRYLRRQVRKHHGKPHTDAADGFSVTAQAYRYQNRGIFLATKEKRKRIFVPLTDGNQYQSQLYVRLYPQENRLELRVPVKTAVREHAGYQNAVGISLGMFTMLTTDGGHGYGESFGELQNGYSEWCRERAAVYGRSRRANPGRKKYYAQKRRYEERLHSYINQELNRFLREECPRIVYMARLPRPRQGGVNRKINHSAAMWQRGYIRERLEQKCREHSVELAEVPGKDIGRECSRCGALGKRENGRFHCEACGYTAEEKANTAGNALKRGRAGAILGKFAQG